MFASVRQNGFIAGGIVSLPSSVRGQKDQTRNLEIPGSRSRAARNDEEVNSSVQLTRFQVWPPQNIPPKAQPWTFRVFGPFIAIVES
jgi:hypothetical protein